MSRGLRAIHASLSSPPSFPLPLTSYTRPLGLWEPRDHFQTWCLCCDFPQCLVCHPCLTLVLLANSAFPWRLSSHSLGEKSRYPSTSILTLCTLRRSGFPRRLWGSWGISYSLSYSQFAVGTLWIFAEWFLHPSNPPTIISTNIFEYFLYSRHCSSKCCKYAVDKKHS